MEEVRRFDTHFVPITLRYMGTPLFWCPHNADFLNWRYLDPPTETYVAFAVVENEEPIAYAVARIDAEEATVVEFAADPSARLVQRALISRILERAHAAGCGWLRFEASLRFSHWRFFRTMGFFPVPSSNYIDLYALEATADTRNLRNWHLTLGDRDYR